MALTNRATFVHELLPGLFGISIDTYDLFNKEEKRWDMLAHTKKSKKDREEKAYRSTLGFLQFRGEGTPINYDSLIGGPKKTWVHDEYALGTRCSINAIEDNLYEDFSDFFKDLGTSAAEQPEVMLARMFNNLTATTYHTAADGLAIASASHTRLDGSTYSNYTTAYADLTYSSFWAVVILLENQYDHRQKRVRMPVKGIVHAPQMNRQAIETLKSTDRPDTTNRAVSAISKKYGTSIQDIDWAYQTDTDAWHVKGKNHDIIFFWRVRPQFSKEPDFETDDVRSKVRLRASVECGDPRGYYHVIP